ncbi:class I fructose-bisphosphate aldolase [Yunchengibacter salinarum]|uniref:class I fructose-bisphosphate aldolase n=1 Tax=Yunchengibacter salinarum TaxID=3133399 RepID=UPI0035B58C65
MRVTKKVQSILSNYGSDNPGTKANLARILCTGRLAGTGRMVILPVDQGFEHGPARSFAPNPAAYDPLYHWQLAIDAGLNAFATTLGIMEAGADRLAGRIPTILKMNSSNSWATARDQSTTASVDDAVRLGCSAVGFTVYPCSDHALDLFEEFAAIAEEAKAKGLAVVLWSYPRGGELSKPGETALDVVAYAAHLAAEMGAHIIKVKLPSDHLEQPEAKKAYQDHGVAMATQADRVRHIMDAAFAGRRLVVFSGGSKKGSNSLYDDARAIHQGGGNGSIIGRNTFQRPRDEALAMLSDVIAIYKGQG